MFFFRLKPLKLQFCLQNYSLIKTKMKKGGKHLNDGNIKTTSCLNKLFQICIIEL